MTAPPAERQFAWWAPFVAMLAAISASTVFAGVLLGAGMEDDDGLSSTGTLVATFGLDLFLLIATLGFARLTVGRVTLSTFGWRRFGRSKALWLVPLLFVLFYVFLQVFGGLVDPDAEDDLPNTLGADESTLNIVFIAVLVCVVAPLVEELFFRGFLFPAISAVLHWIGAAVVAGVIFALVHAAGTEPVFIPPLAVLGFVLCVLYRRIGSLLPGMALHALNNGLALGVALDWSAAGIVASALLSPVVVFSIAWVVADE